MERKDGSGCCKALVDIAIDESFVIKGMRVIEGEKSLFVAYPKEEKNGKWYNVVIPLKREVKEDIEKIILDAYNN